MEREIWLLALMGAFGLFLGTGQTNGYRDREEDLYFPKHYRKAGIFHTLIFRDQKFLRFSVYWTQKLIWFNFIMYSVFLMIGSITKYNISEERKYYWLVMILLFIKVVTEFDCLRLIYVSLL